MKKNSLCKRNFATGDDEVIFDGKAFYLRANEGDEYMKNF